MNVLSIRFSLNVTKYPRFLSRRHINSFLNDGSVVYLEGNDVYRSSNSGLQLISDFRDRKSVIESPIVLKVVHETQSFIESCRREDIYPWNWFDVTLGSRLLSYSKSGVYPSHEKVNFVDLKSMKEEYLLLKSSLGPDFLSILEESNFCSSFDSLTERTVLVQGESSKSRIASALRPFSFYKRILSSKINNSILLITDSSKTAGELGEILSKSYDYVRWPVKNNTENDTLNRMEEGLLSNGYILSPQKVYNMVNRIIESKAPIAFDFYYIDNNNLIYPELSLMKKITLKLCIPGYPELRIYLNSSNIQRSGLHELFSNSEVIKVMQGVEGRSAMIAGLRLLMGQSSEVPRGIISINSVLLTHHHLLHGDYLETRNSGTTKNTSFHESLNHFVLPENFRRGTLSQMLALYYYFSSGLVMNRAMMSLVEERSSIDLEFSRDLGAAYQLKADFFHRYCYRAIHVKDLRAVSTRDLMEESIKDCFKEFDINIQSLLLKAPYGVIRFFNKRPFKDPPFLDPQQLIIAKQKYRLEITSMGTNQAVGKIKKSKQYIRHGEFLPKWTVYAKALKRKSLFHGLDSSRIDFYQKMNCE